jgi:bifunctional non-homologous end joining protein LigD
LDWTNQFPPVATDVTRLPAGSLALDGEIICAESGGRPNFSALQDDLKRGCHDRFVYYAFDLLHGQSPPSSDTLHRTSWNDR